MGEKIILLGLNTLDPEILACYKFSKFSKCLECARLRRCYNCKTGNWLKSKKFLGEIKRAKKYFIYKVAKINKC